MLGYCGINCDNCPAYQGTVTSDMTLLEKAARSYENGAYAAKDWVCLGCLPADQPFLGKFCAQCTVRVCAVGKGVSNCAACAEFEDCAKLQDFFKSEPESLARTMRLLRECFLDRQRQAGAAG